MVSLAGGDATATGFRLDAQRNSVTGPRSMKRGDTALKLFASSTPSGDVSNRVRQR
ncbi:MAG: hypothetical protein ACI9ZF_001783 [Bradyrhizobium sp.]|jgi:hypothetical protein